MAVSIDAQFIETYRGMHGQAGADWAAGLPARVAELEARWSVRVESAYPLSYNWVARAARVSDEQPVVLKIGYPGDKELLSEMAALQAYDGRGIARLLAHDVPSAAMLLEAVLPGVPLEQMQDDDEATRIAAQVMRQLWIAPPENSQALATVTGWGRGFQRLRAAFDGGTGPFPARLVERAERTWAELEASPERPPALLHGDLHHWNILSAQRSPWLAIDPKGLIGEPAYEPGALLRNPWPDLPGVALLLERLPRRLDILHEMLGLDRQRMLAWSFAQAVLSAWWTYEDHHHVGHEMIAFAEGHEALLAGGTQI